MLLLKELVPDGVRCMPGMCAFAMHDTYRILSNLYIL